MRKLIPKFLLIAAIAAIFIAYQSLGLSEFLNLEYLKNRQNDFQSYYQSHIFQTLLAYFAIYIFVTALSLPGATIMTLAGGALFGFVTGLIVVSFASSIGATLAFLASRFLFRNAIQERFGDKLRAINDGVRRDGAFYLFTLRLVPLFPFFVINLVMGLTPIPVATYYWVSQIGMLAGTAVFVNAGTQLAKIDSLSDISSPSLLLSFTLLGLFPLLAKKLLELVKSRKSLSKWPKPEKFDYNVVVIGAGAGGLVSSYIAAAVKAKVALVEEKAMGGDCLNTGCVPSKALIRSAKILSYAQRAKEFGFKSGTIEFDFSEVMERVQRVIATVAPHDSVERYTSLGVECINGRALIKSPYEVEVQGRLLTTKNIIIATGGGPIVPKIDGLDQIKYLTSDTVWKLRTLPKNLLVIGAGPIGCELAQCFSRFGSQVTMVDKAPTIMGKEDPEAVTIIAERFKAEGIRVITEASAKKFVIAGSQKQLICETPKGELTIEFDEVLLALGRKVHAKGFGLEELGVRLTDRGTIEHDEFLRTSIPNIYCVGDVAGPLQFTHFAAHQAWYAAVNALFSPFRSFKADYRVIPRITFTDPEVAAVGLSESEAKGKNVPYEVAIYKLDDLDRAITDEETHGFVKVLTVPGKDRILGATVVGSHAGDYFVEIVAAMRHGLGLNKILSTVHAYPSLGEANKYVAGVWRKAHAPEKLLLWVERFHRWRRS